MNIWKASLNGRNHIRAMPITGNYLIKDREYYIWAERNTRWRIITHGNRCAMCTNIRRDDTEHSPDLWLYTVLKGGDDKKKLIKGSEISLNEARNWYIRQFIPVPNKAGITRFTGLPLGAWWKLWRKKINIDDVKLFGLGNMRTKMIYRGEASMPFLKWWELSRDFNNSDEFTTVKQTKWYHSTIVIPWLRENCNGGIVLFSDYDSMFPDTMDEFAYTTDIPVAIDNMLISK